MRHRAHPIAAGCIYVAILVLLWQLISRLPANVLNDSFERRKLLYNSFARKFVDTYEAPLCYCDLDSWEPIPNKYIAHLHPGYTLEQHKTAVGRAVELETAITNRFSETEYYGFFYVAKLQDPELVAVRADIGFDWVECDVTTMNLAIPVWEAPGGEIEELIAPIQGHLFPEDLTLEDIEAEREP